MVDQMMPLCEGSLLDLKAFRMGRDQAFSQFFSVTFLHNSHILRLLKVLVLLPEKPAILPKCNCFDRSLCFSVSLVRGFCTVGYTNSVSPVPVDFLKSVGREGLRGA